MRLFYFFSVFVFTSGLFGQQIKWTKEVTDRARGLMPLSDGSFYTYGSQYICANPEYISIPSQYANSFLSKYDANGNELFSKNYAGQFFIQKMISHSSGLYFVALIKGNLNYNGINIQSRGDVDGVAGKMDFSGNIIWVKSIGSSGADVSLALTLNSTQTGIVITGGIQDSLYVGNTLLGHQPEKSMFLLRMDLNGNLGAHKLINFANNRNNMSAGMEIMSDSTGNLLLHVCREGKYWSNDTLNAADEGRYIMKFNNALDTVWSRFIINGSCYYGMYCGGLGVRNDGECFIPSRCSGKYGGYPKVERVQAGNGTVTWTSPSNDDGFYGYTYASGSSLFILGEEGANGCPCQSNHRGFAVIKKFNSANQLIGEARIHNVSLTSIIKNNSTLYVTGYTHYKAKIGADSVAGNFILALDDIQCNAVALDTNGYYWMPKMFCDTLVLDAGANYSSYLWSDGSTQRFLKTVSEGIYNVKVTQPGGCIAYSIGSKGMKKIKPYEAQIKYVSYDNYLKKNTVKYSPGYAGYFDEMPNHKITKSANGLIASETYTSVSYPYHFVDSLSWADTCQVRYTILAENSCGVQSDTSEEHRSLFLKLKRPNGTAELSWSKYVGVNYTHVMLMRGSSPLSMQWLADVPATVTSYTDNTNETYYYQLIIQMPDIYIYSNPVGDMPTAITRHSKDTLQLFNVFPNPSENDFTMNGYISEKTNVSITITDVNGRLVHKESFMEVQGELKRKISFNAPAGVYFMDVRAGEHRENVKLIKK